jgi:acetyl esterase/lipase
MDRRTVLGLGAGAAIAGLTSRSFAEEMNADGIVSGDPHEVFPLWKGTPPGGTGVKLKYKIEDKSTDTTQFNDRFVSHVGIPTLAVFRPDKPDGSAVLIAPGGGYASNAFDREGYPVARRLNASGVTAFVLRYRLPAEGWLDAKDVPLQDAQRAMRLIRADAANYAVDPARLGIMGFSAGGHLAATLATRYDSTVYKPSSAVDKLDARPAFACLIYPVITMGDGTHLGSRTNLLGPNPSGELIAAFSCERQVTDRTPPCFIALAADDEGVPPMENGLAMFQALRAAKVPAEMHIFEKGKHGFGIRLTKGLPVAAWPDLFLRWAYGNGWVRDASAAPV